MLNHQITCPNCQQTQDIFSTQSTFIVCANPNCKKAFSPDGTVMNISSEAKYKNYCSVLAIGDEFTTLLGTYTLLGKIVKYEKDDNTAIWAEYCFSNAQNENLILSCYNGHWNVLEPSENFAFLKEMNPTVGINSTQKTVYINGAACNLYHTYAIKCLYVEGEFNFNPFEDNDNRAFEYLRENRMYIVEQKKEKGNFRVKDCYIGEYWFSSDIQKRLNRTVEMPERVGYAGNQPFYVNFNLTGFKVACVIAIMIFLAVTSALRGLYPEKNIFKTTISGQDSSKVIVSPPFEVSYHNSLLEVEFSCSSLYNDWSGVNIALVNNKTDETRYFGIEAEYYAGTDSDGSWSEGSHSSDGVVQNIPAGSYHLEIEPMLVTGGKDMALVITNYKGSFALCLVFASIMAVILLLVLLIEDYFIYQKGGVPTINWEGESSEN